MARESDKVCEKVAKACNGVCFLAFSRGKDSLCAWLQLKKFFRRIIPFTCSPLPHLPFVDEALDYYEGVFGEHIYRFMYELTLQNIANLRYQLPEDEEMIDSLELPLVDRFDTVDLLKRKLGLPNAWTAYGLNMSDSIDRIVTIQQSGGMREGSRSFYPCFDWSHGEIIDAVKNSGIKLSREYNHFCRTYIGSLMPNEVLALKEEMPEEFAETEKYFPLLRAMLARNEFRRVEYERALKAGGANGEEAETQEAV